MGVGKNWQKSFVIQSLSYKLALYTDPQTYIFICLRICCSAACMLQKASLVTACCQQSVLP